MYGTHYLPITSDIFLISGTQKGSEEISLVEVFHSQIPDRKQEEIAADLMNINGRIKSVIATSALSMGFDAAGMYYVWHQVYRRLF